MVLCIGGPQISARESVPLPDATADGISGGSAFGELNSAQRGHLRFVSAEVERYELRADAANKRSRRTHVAYLIAVAASARRVRLERPVHFRFQHLHRRQRRDRAQASSGTGESDGRLLCLQVSQSLFSFTLITLTLCPNNAQSSCTTRYMLFYHHAVFSRKTNPKSSLTLLDAVKYC
jgi:hypothetical protein